MQKSHSIATKLNRTGVFLLLIALLSIGVSLWLTWQLDAGRAAAWEAARLRQVAAQLGDAGQASALENSLRTLRSGKSARPMFAPLAPLVFERLTEVEVLWATQRSAWLQPALLPAERAKKRSVLLAAIDPLVAALEQHLARLVALLTLFEIGKVAMALLAAAFALQVSYRYVINPIGRLREALLRLESGDFSARVPGDSQDEFGQVGAGFNRMAQRLQSLYQGLEEQVGAKTQHIEAQRSRLEALYEVSAFVASAQTVEALANGFAQRVRRFMRADGVVVRWSNEGDQLYLLLASDGMPDAMAGKFARVGGGACLCGNAKRQTRSQVIPIDGFESCSRCLCGEQGFREVVSVPVRLQQRLMGEVNLFYRHHGGFNGDDAGSLDAMGSHLASALESLRAAAFEREAAVADERASLARELHDSIAQSLVFLQIQVNLLRGADRSAGVVAMGPALDELDLGLREALKDVRELLLHFRTRTNTDDIETALRETLSRFEAQSRLPAHLVVKGEGLCLPPDVQVQVLHVLQEGLSNVRKHAGPCEVRLQVDKGARWRFTLSDDGRGFDATLPAGGDHIGLQIMRERAYRIGAQVEVSSNPSKGTQLRLMLPPYPMTRSAAPTAQPLSGSEFLKSNQFFL